MPLLFNEDSVAPIELSPGVTVKRLLTPERTGNDMIALDLIAAKAGSAAPLTTGASGIQAIQFLSGAGELRSGDQRFTMTKDHIAFLPPDCEATIHCNADTSILSVGVPSAKQYDPKWNPGELTLRCTDWTAEPLLDSKFDTRKRIYLVTPKLNVSEAIKGEMIIYPPLASAPEHHHEGAEHFQYVVSGGATVYLSGEPKTMRAGDVLYNYAFERHAFLNDGNEDFVFVEYFVPGIYQTVWADKDKACTWTPTGKNIRGGQSSREIAAHSSLEHPTDV
ncbi:MAG TPA: cupin domain-containing protein [Pseudolabrys sp.]|nr:cupin domain-containing protein [Pseudolabrys sp.]